MPADSAYRTVCEIARGGMGVVELVVRKENDFVRLYARKRLLSGIDEDDVYSMFLDEARIAGMIRHANVVSVLDVGEDDEGPYLIMDYVEGVPLTSIIVSHQRRGLAIPLQLCLHIIEQAAEGLHAAHELRALDGTHMALVHRDVSPANILVEASGRVRVADFGIAKALGRRTKTSEGLLKGKTGYLAPEVLRFREPDRRTDIFALGVVLHELTAGTRLYRGADMLETARRILEEPPPDLAEARFDAPPALVDLVFRMLAKDPEARPGSAREVADAARAIRRELADVEGELDLAAALAECIDEDTFAERRLAAQAATRPLPRRRASTDNELVARPAGSTWMKAAGAVFLLALGAGTTVWLMRDEAAAPTDAAPTAVVEGDEVRAASPVPVEPAATAQETDSPAAELAAPMVAAPFIAAPTMEPGFEEEVESAVETTMRQRAARMTRMSTSMSAMTGMVESEPDSTMRARTSMDPWNWD